MWFRDGGCPQLRVCVGGGGKYVSISVYLIILEKCLKMDLILGLIDP